MHSKVATIGGTQIEYRWTGDAGQSPCIVFLHEGLGCAGMWRDFPDVLAARSGLPGLVYSRQGYGGSAPVSLPRPVDYMQQEGLEHLVRLFDHFAIRKAILFGHSDGGSIALVAGAGPLADRIKGIVALAPHVVIEGVTANSIAALARDYREGKLRDRLARHQGNNVDCAFWGFAGTWLNQENASSWSLVPFLPDLFCPTLVLQGDGDAFGTRLQLDLIRENTGGPCEIVTLAGCGHWPHVEARDEVLSRTLTFIRGAG